jgi:hypothetical protein
MKRKVSVCVVIPLRVERKLFLGSYVPADCVIVSDIIGLYLVRFCVRGPALILCGCINLLSLLISL